MGFWGGDGVGRCGLIVRGVLGGRYVTYFIPDTDRPPHIHTYTLTHRAADPYYNGEENELKAPYLDAALVRAVRHTAAVARLGSSFKRLSVFLRSA